MQVNSICGLTSDEIFHLIGPLGYTNSNAVSVANAVYKKGVSSISKIDGISKKLKTDLESIAITGIFPPIASEISSDSSIKYLFRSEAGIEFETVYIPENKRTTVCVSTQSGCRMGCSFCLTARYGFHGNLSAGDIVNQVVSINPGRKVTHVVFMGMGEPMDNIDNVLKACDILKAEWGTAISQRNITVSTVGITPAILRFLKESDCNLTLSLHSPFSKERNRFIPVENRFPFREIVEIMKSYSSVKKRRFSIAYIMINGQNDSDSHLNELITMLRGSGIRVNLLPYNSVAHNKYTSTAPERLHHFKHNLIISGISASIRKSRGIDISAACGLLASGLD